jgi:hypothetical protein
MGNTQMKRMKSENISQQQIDNRIAKNVNKVREIERNSVVNDKCLFMSIVGPRIQLQMSKFKKVTIYQINHQVMTN